VLKNIRKRTEGFTIVEVLIVLAIAGLIILIVLVAIPALQRNSRNTRVRNDASKAASLLQEAINNNNGNPVNGTNEPSVLDPNNAGYAMLDDVNYNVQASGGSFQSLNGFGNLVRNTVYIRNFSQCATSQPTVGQAGGSQRQFTITFLVETPGTPQTNGNGALVPPNFTAQCIAQ